MSQKICKFLLLLANALFVSGITCEGLKSIYKSSTTNNGSPCCGQPESVISSRLVVLYDKSCDYFRNIYRENECCGDDSDDDKEVTGLPASSCTTNRICKVNTDTGGVACTNRICQARSTVMYTQFATQN